MNFDSPNLSITTRRASGGFTLLEMLVVIVIIAILAGLALPAMKGLTQANTMTVASRQLLDDIASARQKAINNRTKVYMVFVPPNFWVSPATNLTAYGALASSPSSQTSLSNALQLSLGQYTTYALYAEHTIGDQPGQSMPRYLTKWKTLPDGAMIEGNMFRWFTGSTLYPEPEFIYDPPTAPRPRSFRVVAFTNDVSFPFPQNEATNANPVRFFLPYIAFDSQGRVISGNGADVYIPLARGSIFPHRNTDLQPDLTGGLAAAADVVEPNYREANRTNYTLVHIDWLTGRAKVEKPQLP